MDTVDTVRDVGAALTFVGQVLSVLLPVLLPRLVWGRLQRRRLLGLVLPGPRVDDSGHPGQGAASHQGSGTRLL